MAGSPWLLLKGSHGRPEVHAAGSGQGAVYGSPGNCNVASAKANTIPNHSEGVAQARYDSSNTDSPKAGT